MSKARWFLLLLLLTAAPPPEPEQPSLGVGEMLGSAVKNIPSSGWQFVKDVTAPVHSPKQTLKGVGNLALGAAQKLIPGEQGSEQYADAMGRFFKGQIRWTR